MQAFALTERQLSPRAREIEVAGELDLAVAAQLREAISRCPAPLVAIDLGRCEFIDSTGVAVIVQAQRARAADGGSVVVHSAGAQVLRVLSVLGLTRNGLVFDRREDVLAAIEEDRSAAQTR